MRYAKRKFALRSVFLLIIDLNNGFYVDNSGFAPELSTFIHTNVCSCG